MADEPEQATLNTILTAEFVYPNEPKSVTEIEHRKILQMVTDKATQRMQPIFRALLIEILEAQSKHYVNPKSEVKE